MSKRILLLALIASSALFTSCQTTNRGEEGSAQGISSQGIGQTRESVYQWQDRTFRQLAY
jgi:predicted small secreted protein